jgi:hypothetical protein
MPKAAQTPMRRDLPPAAAVMLRYPPLYHYTSDESVRKILESKSLLARPTWDFPDTDEYVHGLRLALQKLKSSAVYAEMELKIPRPIILLYRRYFRNTRRLISAVVPHIEHEIEHTSDPKIQVYVACATTNGRSAKMAALYGDVVLEFNPMAPLLAYSRPEPFLASMLSFVTYDETWFLDRLVSLCLDLRVYVGPPESFTRATVGLDDDQVRRMISFWLAESICILAPNIKSSDWAYEDEWRFKSVRSSHSDANSSRHPRAPVDRKAFGGLPQAASYSTHSPPRYVQQLSFKDKFITVRIRRSDGSFDLALDEMQAAYGMPALERDDVVPFVLNERIVARPWPTDPT